MALTCLALSALRPLADADGVNGRSLLGLAGETLAAAGPDAVLRAVTDFFVSRFSDPSARAGQALRRAVERAWKALEIALEDETWWTRLRDRGEDKALRAQVRAFLRASPLGERGPDWQARCVAELRAARRSGRLHGPDLHADALRRFEGPTALRDAEWRALEQTAESFRQAGHAALAEMVRLPVPPEWTALLALAVRFFFRREIVAAPDLIRELVYDQTERLSQEVQAGLAALAEAVDLLGEVHANVLDLKAEQARQGEAVQAIYAEVVRISRKLDNLHERSLRPLDTVSLRTEADCRQVRDLVRGYQGLPAGQKKELPALLHAVGKLEVAAGDVEAGKQRLAEAARLAGDRPGAAAAHFDAFLAAVEARDLDAALASYGEAVRRGGAPFALFPPGKYQPERILGAGGFGVAFLCRDVDTGGRVVVKALRGETLDRDLGDVFREAAILEGLEHPAIIRVRHCAWTDAELRQRPYLVMDYFDGATLERHGKLPTDDALAIAGQVLDGLRAAHERGVLHRDVKPANVLVRKDGGRWRVKLIDFGLAVPLRTLRETIGNAEALSKTSVGGSVQGTLRYAAPEQLGELPGVKVDRPADLYGFARTLNFMLFGTPEPPPFDWLPFAGEPWAREVNRCLAKQPAERPRIEELAEAWVGTGERVRTETKPANEQRPAPAAPAAETERIDELQEKLLEGLRAVDKLQSEYDSRKPVVTVMLVGLFVFAASVFAGGVLQADPSLLFHPVTLRIILLAGGLAVLVGGLGDYGIIRERRKKRAELNQATAALDDLLRRVASAYPRLRNRLLDGSVPADDKVRDAIGHLAGLKEKPVTAKFTLKGCGQRIDLEVALIVDGKLLGTGTWEKGFELSAQLSTGRHAVEVRWPATAESWGLETKRYWLRLDEPGAFMVPVDEEEVDVQGNLKPIMLHEG